MRADAGIHAQLRRHKQSFGAVARNCCSTRLGRYIRGETIGRFRGPEMTELAQNMCQKQVYKCTSFF
jgi:hypothetical protein